MRKTKKKPARTSKANGRSALTGACLFAGMGGFSQALSRAGVRTLWANELNPQASKSYEHNHPDVRLIEKDIRELSVKGDKLEPVSILTAGFPCQSFSQAGKKGGFEDERGKSFYEIPRLLKEFGDKRPPVILLENVPNLLNGGDGLWFDEVIDEIQDAGYWFNRSNSQVLNTADLTGIPQHRPRLFMVAFSTSYFAVNTYKFPDEEIKAADVNKFINRKEKPSPDHYLHEDNRYCKEIRKAVEEGGDKGVYQLRRYYARGNKNQLCPALTANMGGGGHNVPFIQDRWGIRRLTVAECLKLQGFDVNYRFPAEIPEKDQYQQIGNAVTVPLAEKIILSAKACFEVKENRV